jgi:hypothetical protein
LAAGGGGDDGHVVGQQAVAGKSIENDEQQDQDSQQDQQAGFFPAAESVRISTGCFLGHARSPVLLPGNEMDNAPIIPYLRLFVKGELAAQHSGTFDACRVRNVPGWRFF